MAFGLVAAGQMASTLFPSTSILITLVSLLDVGDEFGCAGDRILAHRFRVIACKALLSGRAIESREKVGKSTFKFKPSRIGSIRQFPVARMVIHGREANPYSIGPVTHERYAMYSRPSW
jgi:hypothetical protein